MRNSLTEGRYVDPLVVDPLEQIFTILSPAQSDSSNSTNGIGLSLNEHERSGLVKKWAAWLAGKDVERGLKVRICFPFLVPAVRFSQILDLCLTLALERCFGSCRTVTYILTTNTASPTHRYRKPRKG